MPIVIAPNPYNAHYLETKQERMHHTLGLEKDNAWTPKTFASYSWARPNSPCRRCGALVGGGYNVVGVVTSPDKPAGRGQKIHRSEVKIAALNWVCRYCSPKS